MISALKKVELLNNMLAIDQMSNYVYNFKVYYGEDLNGHLKRYYCCFRDGNFDSNLNKAYEGAQYVYNFDAYGSTISFEIFADYVNQDGRDEIIEILCRKGCIQRVEP